MSTGQPAVLRSNVISPNDHGAIITITTAILLTCTLLFYVFRLFTRWPLNRLFGWDDTAITVATVLAVGQAATMFTAVSLGLGKRSSDLSTADVNNTYKAMYAGDILYIIALCPAKLGSSLLIDRLTQYKGHLLATRFVSAGIALWGIISAIVIALPCPDGSQPGEGKYVCSNSMARWYGITVSSMMTEVALLILPIYLLWGISIRMSAKIIVVLAFWSRLPILALSALRLQSLRPALLSKDLTFDFVLPEVYAQLDLHYHILAATIASMRPFLNLFNSGYLGTTTAQVQLTTQPSSSPMMTQRPHADTLTSTSLRSSDVKDKV